MTDSRQTTVRNQAVQARPPQAPLVLALDSIVNIVAIVAIAYLCAKARVDGVIATAAIGTIAGADVVTRVMDSRRRPGAAAASVSVMVFLFTEGLLP